MLWIARHLPGRWPLAADTHYSHFSIWQHCIPSCSRAAEVESFPPLGVAAVGARAHMANAGWDTAYGGRIHVFTAPRCEARSKIAAFDLDGTLITTKSGKVFPVNADDWQLLFEPQVRHKLVQLNQEDGYKVVILTNQAGIGSGKTNEADFKSKVAAVLKQLGQVPVQLICSTASDGIFRKPRTGMWEYLSKYLNADVDINVGQCFYCGDAAGRTKVGPKGKKDFSCSDRLFAANLGLTFYTPEEVFLNHKPPLSQDIVLPEFDPKSACEVSLPLLEPSSATLCSMEQEVVLLVGVQGSGKSVFAKRRLQMAGYAVVSNDESGGREKSLNQMRAALKRGLSVVVDNTHVSMDSRRPFIQLAKQLGVTVRCFVMNTPMGQVRHNLVFREIIDTDKHAKIGLPLLNSFKAKMELPTLPEGYSEIVRVNFLPEFEYEEHRYLYRMYLVEK